jgi:DNA-binding NarL/FixJ family response regulator
VVRALQRLRDTPCDVLLLDLSLPGQSGVDVLRAVRQRYESLKVLVLSGFPEERYALPMIRNGANGYLCKDCERDELIKAIRTVAQGRRYVSARTAELMADDLAGVGVSLPHESLSERELQVFLRLAKGESVSGIAEVLNLSVKTISTYRSPA